MNKNERSNWEYIKEFILKILKKIELKLDAKTREYVLHYLKYDEFEMAFEILFIEIIRLNISIEQDVKVLEEAKQIGLTLELNKNSIYDPTFWDNFIFYIDKNLLTSR